MAEDEPEPSRAAGGCVLAVLAGAALGVVFALSPRAGVITVWVVGAAALWWAARRPVSDSSATPPPPSLGDVYAGHRGEVDYVQEGPGEGLLILYPKRDQEVNDE